MKTRETDLLALHRGGLLTRPPHTSSCQQSTNSKQHSVADLILEGHTQDAKFAVDVSSLAPHVASGGDDTKVGTTLLLCLLCTCIHVIAQLCIHLHVPSVELLEQPARCAFVSSC